MGSLVATRPVSLSSAQPGLKRSPLLVADFYRLRARKKFHRLMVLHCPSLAHPTSVRVSAQRRRGLRRGSESHVLRDRLRDDVVSGWRGNPGGHDAQLKNWGGVVNQNLETAAVFRERAEELRLIARNSQDVGARQTLWDLAKEYERKAREREEQG